MLLITLKEITLHIRESRFPWITGLFCALIVLGLLVTSGEVQRRKESYHTKQATEGRRLRHLDASGNVQQQVNRFTGTEGVYAFRRPEPLAPLASGLDRLIPDQIHVSLSNTWPRQTSEAFYRNPIFDLFPHPDFATLVAAVLSLVALFFTFDALAGEKADGTLKLTLSTGVGRWQVLIGKWAGACLTLALPFLLAVLAGVLLIHFVHPEWTTGPTLARTGAAVCLGLFYLSLFVTGGLAISSFSRTPAAALLAALAVWVLAVFIAPRLLASGGAMLEPVPTLQEVKIRKRAVDVETWGEVGRLNRELESKAITQEARDRSVEEAWERAGERKKQIDESYDRKLDARIAVSRRFAVLSPAAAFLVSAAETADTGLSKYSRALREFRTYREAFHQYSADLRARAADGDLDAEWLDVDAVPRLGITEASLSSSLGAVTLELLLLAGLHAVVAALAWAGFLRYDVR